MITWGDQRLPIKSKTFLLTIYSKELNEVFVINFHFSIWNDFAVRKRGGGRDTEQAVKPCFIPLRIERAGQSG